MSAPEQRGSAAAWRLETRMVEKVWGRDILPAPFDAPAGARIGEIWFEPPPQMPDLLVKYLFTSEKLSVQVHPSDADAISGEAGKTECWLVLEAEPGAQLAIGFEQEQSAEAIKAAALNGSIEQLLSWHDVAPGDVFELPPGTVHAIGPGLALVEVQQNSDTTFRLYDYGRPRELHLERGLAVLNAEPHPARLRGTIAARGRALVQNEHFRFDRIEGEPDEGVLADYPGGALILPLEGVVQSEKGDVAARAGECLYTPALHALDFTAARVSLLARSQ
ncbi:MAG: class I mannose-6-phosphate isomerase [Pseudomonadota bacterium]